MDSEFAGEGIDDITVEAGGSGRNELIGCLMIRWVVDVISSAYGGEVLKVVNVLLIELLSHSS